MEQGIIAALKKWCKYLNLKDAVKFSELDGDEEKIQCDAGKKLKRGATGITYGSPTNFCDAALYVREAWNKVTAMTIKSCFAKADLGITLDYDDMEIDETDNFNMTDLIMDIDNITTEDLDIFINIANDDFEEFIQANYETLKKGWFCKKIVL